MKALVCGDRNLTDRQLVFDVLDAQEGIDYLIEGGARGADTLARQWAITNNIPCDTYPADWDKYGKAAGPIRNKLMLTDGKPDIVIAFLAKESRGTRNMIKQAQDAGVYVNIVELAY